MDERNDECEENSSLSSTDIEPCVSYLFSYFTCHCKLQHKNMSTPSNMESCVSYFFMKLYNETARVSQPVTIQVCCLYLRVVFSYTRWFVSQLEMTKEQREMRERLMRGVIDARTTRQCK